MGTLHRIKEYVIYKGITNKDFEQSVGFSNGAFSSQLRNNKTIGVDKLENILSVYAEINPTWLLTGEGEMLRGAEPEMPIAVNSPEGYPLVRINAVGGFGDNSFTIAQRDVKAYYVIPKFAHKKIDFMIEVEGSSMYPNYNSGDIVACSIIKESGFIQWNKVHLIATREQGIIIKGVRESGQESLLMVSDNENYAPFKVPREEITGLAIVVGVIRLE